MPSTEVPYSTIVTSPYKYIGLAVAYLPDGRIHEGTFTLVGRNDFLTATHVIIDDASLPVVRIDFFLGVDLNRQSGKFEGSTGARNSGTLEFTPHEIITWTPDTGSLLQFTKQFNQDDSLSTLMDSEAQYDLALVGVNRAIGDEIGWLNMNPLITDASNAVSVGYPEFSTGMMTRPVSAQRSVSYDIFTSSGGELRPGDSGGPLLVNNTVIGVASGGTYENAVWAALSGQFAYLQTELIGNDSLIGSSASDITSFDFTSAANDSSQSLQGYVGNELIAGEGGNDSVWGGDGNDTLSGGDGADWLSGDDGDDALIGGSGIDTMWGGDGNDILSGGDDTDWLSGDEGDDAFIGGSGNDTILGGDGVDFVLYSSAVAGINVDLSSKKPVARSLSKDKAGVGTDSLSDIENAMGSQFGDRLIGDKNANYLVGLGGNDTLVGGNGNDTLDGGIGADVMTGGGGADCFMFSTLPLAGKNLDSISDFQRGIDSIALSRSVFEPLEAVALNSSSGYLFIKGRDLVFDADASGAQSGVVIVRLAGRAYSMGELEVYLF